MCKTALLAELRGPEGAVPSRRLPRGITAQAISAEPFFSTEDFHAGRSKSFRDKKSFRGKTPAAPPETGRTGQVGRQGPAAIDTD
jgi:hypothetical protein